MICAVIKEQEETSRRRNVSPRHRRRADNIHKIISRYNSRGRANEDVQCDVVLSVLFTFQVQSGRSGAALQEPRDRQDDREGQAAAEEASEGAAAGRRRERQVHLPQADEDHPRRQVRTRPHEGVPADHLPERHQGHEGAHGRQGQAGHSLGRQQQH